MGTPCAVFPIQAAVNPNIIQGGDYNAMIIAADIQRAATSDEAVVAELYTGGVADGANLIGRWSYDAVTASWQPALNIQLDRVTDSEFGEQDGASPTTGTTRLMQSGHSLPASGLMTVWDRDLSATIATGLAFTVSGDTVTFVDPGATATDDVFLLEGTCEFGDLLTRAGGGLWSPRTASDILVYWDSGLNAVAGTGTDDTGILISFAGKPAATGIPKAMCISGRFDFINAAAGVDSHFGLGNSSANDLKTGAAGWTHRTAPNWQKGAFVDFMDNGNLVVSSTGNMGLPGTVLDRWIHWQVSGLGDNVNVAYSTESDPLIAGTFLAPQNSGVDANGIGARDTIFGPADGALWILSLKNGGGLSGVMKELATRFIS